MKKILIIEPDRSWCFFLYEFLSNKSFQVDYVIEIKDVLKTLESEKYDVLIMDTTLQGLDVFKIIDIARDLYPEIDIILMSDNVSGELALKALQRSADIITKPFNANQILLILKRQEELKKLIRENEKLREQFLNREEIIKNIIGKSKPIKELKELIIKIAPTDSTVLIMGESGTGKELVAQAIHKYSNRKNKPFVTINCGALPENLLESELFGYEKGAFTGATTSKKGLVKIANGGTLFLDEVGELPLSLQVKLLRLLQFKEFIPLGSTKTEQVDIRIIAATNKNLKEEVERGNFREDLFYRLNVVPIYIPPLRERVDDIPLLINYFTEKYAIKYKKEIKNISLDFIRTFTLYKWPGNVRELENIIERVIIFNNDGMLTSKDIPAEIREFSVENKIEDVLLKFPLTEAKREFEKRYIIALLKKTKGNVSKACEIGKIGRPYFYKKLKEYGINHYKFKI